ncbi:hypothetical protein [Chitinophaga sp. YIM B06452]|uniref:hypothetical protein n=1 Tax=Chitinophaga sp. YIM B06452 TaxID=3082158 RepID=UPI0031FE7F63
MAQKYSLTRFVKMISVILPAGFPVIIVIVLKNKRGIHVPGFPAAASAAVKVIAPA